MFSARTATLILVFIAACFCGCNYSKISPCVHNYGPYKIEDSVHLWYCNYLQLGKFECEWDFGDGSKAKGEDVMHLYNTAGNYTVTQRVSTKAHTATQTETIEVVGATAYDYEGTFVVRGNCVCDTSHPCGVEITHQVTITAFSPTSATIFSLNQSLQNVNAYTNQHQIVIPKQVLAGDTVSGSGSFSAKHDFIYLNLTTLTDTTIKVCFLNCERQ